jgi:hypothetical protein
MSGFDPPLANAAISCNANGDNTLISGVSGKTIRVFKIAWTLAAGTLTLKDGASTTLTGAMSATAGVLESTDGKPLWLTGAGNNFVANLSGANQLSGCVWYEQTA